MSSRSDKLCSRTWALAAASLLVLLSGCTSIRTTEIEIKPGRYTTTFDAAREVLTDYRFRLDRVDARLGVITTQPKNTSGLASPWDKEQTTIGQEVEDLLNQQRRVVRVTFVDEGGASANADSLNPGAPILARVEVIVYRVQSPGLRTPTRVVSMSSVSTDPVAARQGTGGAYEVPVSQDSRLAARLAEEIARRAGDRR